MFKAVVFDMDGVLADTERVYYAARLAWLAKRGITTSHLPKSYFNGGRMRDLWPGLLGERYGEYDVEELQADYVKFRNEQSQSYADLLFPDAAPLLHWLKSASVKVGLATSSNRSQIQKFLGETHLATYFDAICSGEDFRETKPHPEIYLTAMKKLRVRPSETLVIEDSTVGIAAGVASGARVWAIRDHEFDLDQSSADLLVENLREIQERLVNRD